ncbi:MAG: hypothetical protein IPN72_09365 [Saprospiraceae bacterium]|nr:hypothetical protein [Saprospiraceae bacterium]
MKIVTFNSYGLLKVSLFLALSVFSINAVLAQQTLTTKLGQTIILEKDGTYKIIPAEQIAAEATINPFEKPKAINQIDASEKLRLEELNKLFFANDAKLSALIQHLDANISLKQGALQFAQDQKNQLLIPQLMVELDSLKRLSGNSTKQYEVLIKDFETLSQIKSMDNEAGIVSAINTLYQKYNGEYGVSAAVVTSSKKEKVKLTMDQRAPWEIKSNTDTITRSLLTYTPDRLKNYYKGRFLLEVFAELMEGRQVKFEFIFNSKDIKKGYGIIKKGDFLRIDFIKGQSISLKAVKDVEPRLETYTGNTIYTSVYQVKNKDDYKKLTTSLLDTIGVMWSSGFESYPVYNIDFFKVKKDVGSSPTTGK